MKTALYLDDVRTPSQDLPNHQPWSVVRNFDEFVDYITTMGIPDFISFDHDLAQEHMDDYYKQIGYQGYQHPQYEDYIEKTGLDCAKWLVEYAQKNKLKLGRCAVHSHNPVGAANIQSLINGFKRHMGWEEDCYLGRIPFTVNS